MKSAFNGRSTTLFVQNVEGAPTAVVNLEARMNDNKIYYASFSVPKYAAVAVQPSSFRAIDGSPMPVSCNGSGNPGATGAACFGAVRLTSGSLFAAVAVEHPSTGVEPVPAVIAQHLQEIGNRSPLAQRRLCPLIKNTVPTAQTGPNEKLNTSTTDIAIMNATNGAIHVAAKLVTDAGDSFSQMFPAIPLYSSVMASPAAGTAGGFPVGAQGYAVLDSTQEFNATVSSGPEMPSSGYHCHPGGSLFLSAPLIMFEYPSASVSEAANTEVLIHNDSDETGEITAIYWCRAADSTTYNKYTVNRTAPPHASIMLSPATIPRSDIPSGLLCAAHFSSVGTGAWMQALITQTTRGLAIPPRDDATYEATHY